MVDKHCNNKDFVGVFYKLNFSAMPFNFKNEEYLILFGTFSFSLAFHL